MILSWVTKVVAGVGLAGLAAFEIGSPLVTRVQVDEAAHLVADAAAVEYFESQRSTEEARVRADEVAAEKDVTVTEFVLDDAGAIQVTVSREALSLVMANFEFAKGWYDVRVEASAVPKGRSL